MTTLATEPTDFEISGLRGTLGHDIMLYLAAYFKTPHAIIGEYGNNAVDARSSTFEIEVKRNGDVLLIDRGEGMPMDRFAAFIGAGDRGKRDDETRDTLGRYGFGGTSGFMSHEVIEVVETSTADDPFVHSFKFTAQQAFEASLPGGEPIRTYRRMRKADARHVRTSGTVIALRKRRTDEDRVVVTASKLTANLHRVLPPRMRKKVKVNGRPLKMVEPDGKFYDSGEEGVLIPDAGPVQILFGVSSKPTRPIDSSWGSTGLKWTHADLCTHIPEELTELVPMELGMPNVWFEVRCYAWKDKEQPGRDGYKPSFFTQESFRAVLAFIRANILPELRKKLRMFDIDDKEDIAIFSRTMSTLNERLGEPGEPGPGIGIQPGADAGGDGQSTTLGDGDAGPVPEDPDAPEVDPNPLRVNPTSMSLLVGQVGEFYIEDSDPDATYLVETVQPTGPKILVGGSEETSLRCKGLGSFQIKAGTVYGEDYTLRVTKSLPGKPDAKVRLLVKVLKEMKFSIQPGGITLEPGETYNRELRVLNAEGLSGFTWEFSEGRIVPSPDGLRATPTAGRDVSGKFRIRVVASDGTEAFCRVRIKEPPPKVVKARNRNVVVDGVKFRLNKRRLPGGKALTGSFFVSKHSYEIMLNLDRPVAVKARREGPKVFGDFVLRWTVMEIAKVLSRLELERKEKAGEVDDPVDAYQLILERTQLRLLDKALG